MIDQDLRRCAAGLASAGVIASQHHSINIAIKPSQAKPSQIQIQALSNPYPSQPKSSSNTHPHTPPLLTYLPLHLHLHHLHKEEESSSAHQYRYYILHTHKHARTMRTAQSFLRHTIRGRKQLQKQAVQRLQTATRRLNTPQNLRALSCLTSPALSTSAEAPIPVCTLDFEEEDGT